jgi:hypothetical protein
MKNKKVYLVRDKFEYVITSEKNSLVLEDNEFNWDWNKNRCAYPLCIAGINRLARPLGMKVGEYRELEISKTKPKSGSYWELTPYQNNIGVFTSTYIFVIGIPNIYLPVLNKDTTYYAYEV